MDDMDWKKAKERLEDGNPRLAKAFDAVFEECSRSGSDKLCTLLEEYPFGSDIIDGGRAVAASNKPLSDKFLMPNGLPFGVILKNGCEVFDWLMSQRPLPPRSQAVLTKGSCIGLFEMLDDFTEGSHGVAPDWNIAAGAASLTLMSNIRTAQAHKRLSKEFGSFDSSYFNFQRTTAQKLMTIPSFQEECNDWRAEILFFSPKWFSYIFESSTDAALAARLALYEFGWIYASRVRDTRTRLFHYFTSRSGETEGDFRLVELSRSFLRYISDIFDDRRPLFLFEDSASELGPIKLIRDRVLGCLSEQETKLLVPGYLSQAGDNGFLPLDHISPRIVTGQKSRGTAGANTMENITVIFERIRNASNNIEAGDLEKEHMLIDLNRWIDRLAFRTPVPKRRDFDPDKTGFRITVNEDRNRRIEKDMILDRDFFAPHFEDPPLKNSEFFRNCLKVRASEMLVESSLGVAVGSEKVTRPLAKERLAS